MVRITAGSQVTRMQNSETRRDRSFVDFERDAMRQLRFTLAFDLSVTLRRCCPDPEPTAGIWFGKQFCEQPDLQWFRFRHYSVSPLRPAGRGTATTSPARIMR